MHTYVCICFETTLDLTFPVYIQLQVDLSNSLILPPLKQACNQHISTNKNRDKNTRARAVIIAAADKKNT